MKSHIEQVNFDGMPDNNGSWWRYKEICDKCSNIIYDIETLHSCPPDENETDFCFKCMCEFIDKRIDYEQARIIYNERFSRNMRNKTTQKLYMDIKSIEKPKQIDNRIHYNGYSATIMYSSEDNLLYGIVQDINDCIMFEGKSIDELKESFQETIDDYIDICKRISKEPNGCKMRRNLKIKYLKIVLTATGIFGMIAI